jgi:hypothetical protein
MDAANLPRRDGVTRPARLRPVAVGAACLALTLGWNLLFATWLGREALSQAAGRVFSYEPQVADWVISGILTPLSETVIMALIWIVLTKTFARNPENPRAGLAYVTIVAVLGFVAHGGTPLALSRGVAFVLLGLLFLRARTEGGLRRACSETATAHVVWNVAGLALLDLF